MKLVSYWAPYHIVPDLIGCVAKEEDLECAWHQHDIHNHFVIWTHRDLLPNFHLTLLKSLIMPGRLKSKIKVERNKQ